MSYFGNVNVQCERIQTMLDDAFTVCKTPTENMAALEAVLDTQKNAGIKQSVVNDANSSVKTVRVIYEARALESAVTKSFGPRVCSITNPTQNSYQDYSLDPTYKVQYGESFTVAELTTICTDDANTKLAKKTQKVVDVIERAIATQTANEFVALYGKYGSTVGTSSTVNGSDELVVSTQISQTTKAIDHTALTKMGMAFMKTGYCANPIILAGSAMWEYGQYVKAGCCATTGVNIADLANSNGNTQAIVYDKRIEAALGGNGFKSLAFQPGSVALLYYNQFMVAGMLGGGGSNYVQTRMYGPRTGLPIDITYKDDCGTISIVGVANTKLVGLPTDMFAVGDEYRGVTFVNKILITNPA